DPALFLLLGGQLVVRGRSSRSEKEGKDWDCDSHVYATTFSAFGSQLIVFFCRYDSTASLIATIVLVPSSTLQFSGPPPRMTSRKLPTMSRRGLTANFASSLPSFFAWNSGLKSP